MIRLSKRLNAILSWVEGDCLADIGCDHAYLACAAVLNDKVSTAYACDVALGPLDHAKETITEYNLQDKVRCILMNGISQLPNDVDCIVIAGMGSQTVIDILTNGKNQINSSMHFIVSVHKDVEILRKFLSDHNFIIQKECIIRDGQHYYPILSFVLAHYEQTLIPQELYYGKNVLKDDSFYEFIDLEIKKWESINKKIQSTKNQVISNRLKICYEIKNTHS